MVQNATVEPFDYESRVEVAWPQRVDSVISFWPLDRSNGAMLITQSNHAPIRSGLRGKTKLVSPLRLAESA